MVIGVRVGQELTRDHFLHRLVDLQYTRNDIEFMRGQFRVRGDTVELCPPAARTRCGWSFSATTWNASRALNR